MFFKTAHAKVLGSWSGDSQISKTAFVKTSSYFMQNVGRLDIAGVLEEVADFYKISRNPKDYLFTPVRANSVDVPNENGDGFDNEETLRFDPKIGRRVYQTYLLKPHHINHRADNPRMARGTIVDVHYNDSNPMPPEWRSKYEASVGKPIERDIFVEALLAIDTTKDPYLANGMRTGAIDSFSMGCECDKTICNVCANVATSKLEFCPHIRYGNKMKWFVRGDGRKVQAFEWCKGVVYGELSAVDQPADPRAFGGKDIFQLHAGLESGSISRRELMEIVAFTKAYKDCMPSSLERIISSVLDNV